MLSQKFYGHFAGLLLSVCLAGCSPTTPGDGTSIFYQIENSPRHYMDPEIERTSKSLHHYLVGQMYSDDQDYDKALEHLAVAGELSSERSAHLHRKLAELYVRSGELEKALEHSTIAYNASPGDPSILFLHAGTLETIGNDKEAEAVYLKLMKQEPENFDVYVLLGSLYSKHQQYGRGIELLNRYISDHSENAMAHYFLGHMYELSGKIDLAEKHYLKSYELQPGQAHVVRDVVRLYLKSENVKKAVAFCRKVIEASPHNVLARRVLSHLLLGEGKLEEAIEQFQVLESVESNSADARFKIALIQIERQNFKEALTDLHLVLARDPDHDEARFYLGTVYAGMGEPQKAIQELMRIKRGEESFVKARTFAAFVFRQEGQLDKAEEVIKEAFEADPADEKIISYLMLIYRDRGKFKEASDFLEKLLERFPDNEKYRFHYAVIQHDLGNRKHGIEIMEEVVRRNPANADALNFIAYSLAEDGQNLDRAFELVKRALEIDSDDPFYIDTLGWIYYQRGEYDRAVKELKKAVAGAGNDVVVIEHYGDALVKVGNEKEAQRMYKKALEAGSQEEQNHEGNEALLRVKNKLDGLSR